MGALAIESSMKTQKRAMGLVGGRYNSNAKSALAEASRADGMRNRYQGALRRELAGTWRHPFGVHIADTMAYLKKEAGISKEYSRGWLALARR